MPPMQVVKVRAAEAVHPTGDPNFTVRQPFPAAITAEEADPFLMCDKIGPRVSAGVPLDPDEYPVDWHPHRGQDICSYLVKGRGRHADSLGNRTTFRAPGLQWCATGSGIEHAEGGGTPAGEENLGLQIWINVPRAAKSLAPRYGTHELLPEAAPAAGVAARVVAGPAHGATGPFETVQPVQMVDYTLQPGATITHEVPDGMDNALAYVYIGGASTICSTAVPLDSIALLDARGAARDIVVTNPSESTAVGVMVFAGKRLREPIAWLGPIVMTSQAELRETFMQLRQGAFPPVRVPWDYTKLASFPEDKRPPA